MRRIGPLLLVLACLACLPTAAAEAQDPWRPVVTSCVTAEAVPGCTQGRAIAGAWNTTITPDGRTAYVAGFSTGAIGVFDRDAATGALRQKPGAAGCIRDGGGDGCATGRGLLRTDGIAVAPDGVRVHVSTWSGGDISKGAAVLRRDPATGALSQRAASESCITGNASTTCLDGHGFGGLNGSLAASPDGAHLYVGVNPVAVVRSSPSGILSQDPGLEGCVSTPAQDGCTGVLGLGASGRQPVVAPDGRQVYVPSGDGIAVLDRDATTGALSQRGGGKGCLVATAVDGCTTDPRVAGVLGLVMDREGRHVYATSSRGMITLARAADGSLSVQGCVRDVAIAGCTRGTAVANLDYAAISPDGHDLVASSFAAALIAFRRDPATGALVQRAGIDGCITTDGRAPGQGAAGACRAHPSIGSDAHVTFGSDSHLYGGGFDTASVATVKRDFAPVCADTAVPVPHATATPVRLACSDRNGDPIALSIADAPRSGSLGAIDQGAGSVLYGPFGGFTGPDAFTFRGTAAGLTSAPARGGAGRRGAGAGRGAAARAGDVERDDALGRAREADLPARPGGAAAAGRRAARAALRGEEAAGSRPGRSAACPRARNGRYADADPRM